MIEVRRSGARSRSVVTDGALASVVSREWPDAGAVERSLSVYSTSATVEDVVVHRHGGAMVRLLLKDLSPDALLHGRLVGRPVFLVDPCREVVVYRHLLRSERDGTARCFAAEDDGDRQWLLLEKVPGIELYQVGDLAVWCAAAEALAELHAAIGSPPPAVRRRLLVHDEAYLRRWMTRAIRFAHQRPPGAGGRATALRGVHDQVVRRLARLPAVVVHGDLYASNVLVATGSRVCPVDWELAGLAPAVTDLAALTSGSWSEDERRAMALTYHRAMREPRWRPGEREFLELLDVARLQLCIQWLGWAEDWTPPPEHAHDWLTEACTLADRLSAD